MVLNVEHLTNKIMKKYLLIIFAIIGLGQHLSAQYSKVLTFRGTGFLAGNYGEGIYYGAKPYGDFISVGNYLYGMTSEGGCRIKTSQGSYKTTNGGLIFRISADGTPGSNSFYFSDTLNNLYGAKPKASLISDGTYLYGMTSRGGKKDGGVIFKIKIDLTGYTKLFDFVDSSTGGGPTGSLISDGTYLYGTAGILFKIKPDGSGFVNLHNFRDGYYYNSSGKYVYDSSNSGSVPVGSLISDGTYLYGMTNQGGKMNDGVIYKIKPDGTGYIKLLDFTGSNGSNPQGSLISDGTYLYGMTSEGGTNNYGTIFKIKSDGSGFSKLYEFNDKVNGMTPTGSIISDGTYLYGVTSSGGNTAGASYSGGVIFKIKPDGSEFAKLYDFHPKQTDIDGSSPNGSLTLVGTSLYGMTPRDWGELGLGTIFKFGLNTTGISSSSQTINSLQIFPNPATNELHIESTDNEKLTAQLFDITGKEVISSTPFINSANINIQTLIHGIYFLRITNERTGSINIQKVAVVR